MTDATIITLHGIRPDGQGGLDQTAAEAWYTIPASIFGQLTKMAKDRQPGTVRDFLNRRSIHTILTFDDGLISDYLVALPILRECGVKATFFVSASNIGCKGYMSASQLREMASNGMEIGSHGLEHRYLVTLPWAVAEQEIAESKERIEQILGQPIVSFAAVGGHFQSWMLGFAEASGYQAFATMIPGRSALPTKGGIALLRRNHVQAQHALQYISALIEGKRNILAMNLLRYRLLELPKKVLGLEGYDRLKNRVLALFSAKGGS